LHGNSPIVRIGFSGIDLIRKSGRDMPSNGACAPQPGLTAAALGGVGFHFLPAFERSRQPRADVRRPVWEYAGSTTRRITNRTTETNPPPTQTPSDMDIALGRRFALSAADGRVRENTATDPHNPVSSQRPASNPQPSRSSHHGLRHHMLR